MKKLLSTLFCATLATLSPLQAEVSSKIVINEYGAQQLHVNGKPYIMIAGELHNSSASTVEYLNGMWPSLCTLNVNTVLAAVAWEQFEPKEGVYDYTLVDALIDGARRNNIKICLLWFASWKNGESSYVPTWIKENTQRFFRIRSKEGKEIETISPFCDEARRADSKAFAALMRHIRQVDGHIGTVIAMQPENEVGVFQDIDYSKPSLNAFEQEVPQALLQYMKNNRALLQKELLSEWEKHGAKMSGTWKNVFGETPWAKSYFTTWQYASYVNDVARAGKSEYNLPMFANCWLVQKTTDLPGIYPNGGPVSRVMDIWKAAAPAIDVLAPDIYLPDFKNIIKEYYRKDNPLWIPEAAMQPGWAFYAFGEHHALCFSPFGIEDGAGNYTFAESYRVLNELMPTITQFQGSKRMIGILKAGNESERIVSLGNYQLRITYENTNDAYGLIIQTEENEFIVAGINFKVKFSSNTRQTAYIKQVWEGGFSNKKWVPTRLLNGDETFHNSILLVKGRQTLSKERVENYETNHSDQIFVYSPESFKSIWSAGIYKVTTYLR